MTREIQAGQILGISEIAAKEFPEAKKGNILLHHYFVTGKEAEDADGGRYHIYSDPYFNYYTVSSTSHNGRPNECYAVFNGEKIITNKEYIFLEVEPPPFNNLTPEEFISKNTHVSKGGVLVFKEWKISRKEKGERMQTLKFENQELARTPMNPEVKKKIEDNEKEMSLISADVNKPRYEPYTVAASNPTLDKHFKQPVKKGDVVYMKNNACQTKIQFLEKEYIVAKVDNYIGMLYHPSVSKVPAL